MAYIQHETRVSGDRPSDRITRVVGDRPRRMWYRSLAALAPDHLPGLQLHLDAQALALADGAAVASWPDLSPNAVPLTQSDPALQPSVAVAGINGKKSVRFGGAAGVGKSLAAATGSGTRPASGRLHYFVVMANGSRADYMAAGISPFAYLEPFGRADNTWYIGGAGYGFHAGAATVIPGDNADIGAVALQLVAAPALYEVAYDGLLVRAWQDGVSAGSDDVDGTALSWPDGVIAAGAGNGSYPMVGDIGEIIMFDRVLGDNERLGVTGHLFDRWQLAGG